MITHHVGSLRMWHRLAIEAAVIVATVAIVVTVFTVWRTLTAWDPLGDYPLQRVVSTAPGRVTPAVYVGDDVVTEATKCVEDKNPVTVRAQGRWTMVDPAGFSTNYHVGQANDRLPGCTRTTHSSPMPQEVIDRVNEMCSKDRCETVWRKDGIETPVAPDGRHGEPRYWFTGNFTIIVPRTP